MKRKLSRFVTVSFCIVFFWQSVGFAGTAVMPDNGADIQNRPTIESAPNGTQVVNIVSPSPQGVSHNKYLDFNVDPDGLILNNSSALVRTDLAGYIFGNPNLGSSPARIILNEVTSSSPSHLTGFTEVAGPAADIVLANPNGISINGAGFLNTPRVTLTTGVPVVEAGSLDRIDVYDGSINIDGIGLNASGVDSFDIISRTSLLNAAIHAENLNLILGRNEVDFADLAVNPLPPVAERPDFSLDSSLLGGMYAGRIRLIGTEFGVGVRIAGDMASSTGDISLSGDGLITLTGQVVSAENFEISAQKGITVTGKIIAGNNLIIDATQSGLINTGEMIAGEALEAGAVFAKNTGFMASAGSMDLTVSGSFENNGGTIFSVDDLFLGGMNDSGGLTLLNDAGVIESWDGNISISAKEVFNRSNEPVVFRQDYSIEGDWIQEYFEYMAIGPVNIGICSAPTGTCWRTKDITEGYVETLEPYQSFQSRIVSGGNILIEADTLSNEYSLISAGSDMVLSGRRLENIGRDVVHEWMTTTLRYEWYERHHTGHVGCENVWGLRAPLVDGPNVEIIDGVYGILESGGNLNAYFSEEIDNGKRLEGIVTTPSSVFPEEFTQSPDQTITLASGWDYLFQETPDGQFYLIETRAEFSDLTEFASSDYMLERLGYNPDESMLRLGDGFYETLIIRDEIVEKTGRRFLSSDYKDEKQQYLALMDNAVDIAPVLELEVGLALQPEQVEMLTHDIIWLVETEVDGQSVLVPQIYLSRVHDENFFRGSQIVADGDLTLFGGEINNYGQIRSEGNLALESKGSITTHQGDAVADGRLQMSAGDSINIAGGQVSGSDVLINAGKDIDIETLHQHNSIGKGKKTGLGKTGDFAVGHNTVVGEVAHIKSDGILTLEAGSNVSVEGATVEGGSVSLTAGDSITVDAVEDSFDSAVYFKGGFEKLERTRQLGSRIAGEEATFTAGDDIVIRASEVISDGNLEIVARDSLVVASAEEKDSREFRMKQSSGFDSKTVYSYDESSRQIGSTLSAGGQLNLRAGVDHRSEVDGRVSMRASQLNSGSDMVVTASGEINIDAGEEREFSESYVKKSNAVRKKESFNSTEQTLLKRTGLNAGGSLVIGSEVDINIVAADVKAEEMLVLSAGADGSGNLNLLSDNEATETLKYTRRSGIDISYSDDFASFASDERHTYGNRREETVASELEADTIYLSSATDVNMVGAAVEASGNLLVQAGRDVNVLNAVKVEGSYEEHRDVKYGIAVDIDQDSAMVFAGAEKKKDAFAKDSQNSSGSNLQAGNDLVLLAGNDLNQVGSNLTAGRDVVLDAGGAISSLASTDVTSLYEFHEQLRAGFTTGIQHNIGSAIDAVENIDDSGNLLTGASRTLKAVDAVNNAAQPSFSAHFGVSGSQSESSCELRSAQTSSIISGRDIVAGAEEDVELEGTMALAGRDIILAAENVRLMAAANSSQRSDESRTFRAGVTVQGSRNSGSVSLGVSGSNSEFDQESEYVNPVLLQAGRDVSVDAVRRIELEGAQLATNANIDLTAGESLDIHAAAGSFISDSESYNYSAEVGMSASKQGVGYYVGLSGGQSDLDREGKDHINASVVAGGDMNIAVGGDAAVRGANLKAENIRADIGGDLYVGSIADTGSVDGERWSAGVTIGIGTASGVSGSYGETDGEKDWIGVQTSIVARNNVDINVGNHTQLDAALIASETGNLKLETDTFSYSDHYGVDREESFDSGFGISGVGGGPANQQSGAGVNDIDANWSVDGGYSNRDRQQTVRATIGEGEVIVRTDAENGTDSINGLNRNIEKAYVITKDESDSYEIYASENAIDSVANYDDTLARWGYVALNYGRETVAAVKGTDYITKESGIAELVMDAVDAIEILPLGVLPGRENYGGWVTQLPVLLSGDMEFYKVTAFLQEAEKAGHLELIKETLEVDEINIHDPEQLKSVLKMVDYAATNGINNSLELAIRNGAMQTGATNFIQEYNPTHGLVGDLVECLWDVSVGGTINSGNARNISDFYSLVDQTGKSLNVASHSQGTLLNYRALDDMSFAAEEWEFQFFGAPVRADNLNGVVSKANAEYRGTYIFIGEDNNDSVGTVLGLNARSGKEFLTGVKSLPSLLGPSSPHSNYYCQGDFCAGQQQVLREVPLSQREGTTKF